MSAEDTPKVTMVDHRWDSPKGREDWKTYDYVYEIAEDIRRNSEDIDQAASKLMLTVINEWEKAPRSVPVSVLLGTISLADAYSSSGLVDAPQLEPA